VGLLDLQHALGTITACSYLPYYDTELCFQAYAALIYYFGISAIYTAYVYRRGPSSRDGNKLTHIEMYIWLSYELSWTSAWFVALSYWLVLILPLCTSPGANCTFKYPSINSHGVNVILILVETVLNKYDT